MTWDAIRVWLLRERPGRELSIHRTRIAHPADAGALSSVGLPRGQVADWRFPADGQCRGVHVREFRARYRVHMDRAHPSCGLLDHFFRDVLPGRWAVEVPVRAEDVEGLT
jgi:hypothetical protein